MSNKSIERKQKFIKETGALISQPKSYVISQGLAFGLFMFIFQAIYFVFFTEDRPLYFLNWIYLFISSILIGLLYGVCILYINRYYVKRYKAELGDQS